MFRGLKFTAVLMVFLSLPVFVSCSTQYGAYSKEIYTGKKLLEEKEYEKSKELFSQASRDQRNSTSLAMLGTTYYKMGDIANAESSIKEAEKIDKNSESYMRILGYKSLILLKQGDPDGYKALRQYADYVKNLNLPFEMHDILSMIAKQTADMAILDATIEKQIIWYENEMDNWNSGVPSYFSDKFGRPM